jgi:hypothetical protein
MMTLFLLSSGGRGSNQLGAAVRAAGHRTGEVAEGVPATGKSASRRLIPSRTATLIARLHYSRRTAKIVP